MTALQQTLLSIELKVQHWPLGTEYVTHNKSSCDVLHWYTYTKHSKNCIVFNIAEVSCMLFCWCDIRMILFKIKKAITNSSCRANDSSLWFSLFRFRSPGSRTVRGWRKQKHLYVTLALEVSRPDCVKFRSFQITNFCWEILNVATTRICKNKSIKKYWSLPTYRSMKCRNVEYLLSRAKYNFNDDFLFLATMESTVTRVKSQIIIRLERFESRTDDQTKKYSCLS